MAKLHRAVSINAPVEKVFAFVEDPSNFPVVWPSMVDVRNVEKLPSGGRKFDWTYKMAGMKLDGTSQTTEYQPNARIVSKTAGGIESSFVWTFKPEGGGSHLDVEIEYVVPVPVLGKLAESIIVKLNEREADVLVANIKDQMEA
jgi:uncharacterized membrane protein